MGKQYSVFQKITHQRQMSEAFILNAVLAFSGGFQDAYTYFVRDGVFANAQTGNIVLMSMNLMSGKFYAALHYLLPIASFAAGVFASERAEFKFKKSERLHWRQGVVLLEMAILFAVGFIPTEINLAANALVSFSCAMQVQAFRKMGGNAFASTMCIGNLKNGTTALSVFLRSRKKADLERGIRYFSIITIFALGAGFGGIISNFLGIHSIWLSTSALLIAFILMHIDLERDEKL